MSDIADFTNKIITGDCVEVFKSLPKNSIDFLVTSPPYNLGLSYQNSTDSLPYDKYLKWMKDVWKEAFRVIEPGGRVAINIAPTGINPFIPVHHDMVQILVEIGFILRGEILWYKQTMRKRTAWGSYKSPSNPHIIPSWEYVYLFSKKDWKHDGEKSQIDITSKEFKDFSDAFWVIRPETKNRQPFLKGIQKGKHPAAFPERLIYRLLKYYTYKNDIVLDPFGGSGTVASVCKKTGRRFIHIDISEEYNRMAQKRILANGEEVYDDNMKLFSENATAS